MDSYLYIFQCDNGLYYVGHSENVPERLKTHQVGVVSFLKTGEG